MAPIIALAVIGLVAAAAWAWLQIATSGGDPVHDGCRPDQSEGEGQC